MMCFHTAEDGVGGTLGCTQVGCTTLWPDLQRVRLDITGRKCPDEVTWHSRELSLPAHLSSVSLPRVRPAPQHRQLLKGSVRRWQLKVQTSLPHCSLHEWPCLCNTEDVLNGRAQAVNHHIITAGVSQPVYHQAFLWVK